MRGNAERFADQWSACLRYCQEYGAWLFYDGTRWNTQLGEEMATQRAISTVRGIAVEANGYEKEKRDKYLRWSMISESSQRLKAMLSIAQSLPGLCIHADQFDHDPWVLNCLNGTGRSADRRAAGP